MFRIIRESRTGIVPTSESYPTLYEAQSAADWHNEFSKRESRDEHYGVEYPND